MKKVYISIVALAALFCSMHLEAQSFAISKAEEYLNTRNYNEAIPVLEKLSAFKNSDDWKHKLGRCYMIIKDFTKAESVFSKIEIVVDNEFYYEYAEAKQYLGKYDEAISLYKKYKAKGGTNPMVDLKINACNFAKTNTTPNKWNIQPNANFVKGIYTGGCFYNDQLWFGFKDPAAAFDNQNESLHNVYASNADSYFTEYIPNDQLLKTKYYIGGVSFSKTSDEVIYSLQDSEVSSTQEKHLHKHKISSEYLNTLNLHMGVFNGKEITDVAAFPFNSKEYSCMHPCFSASGNICYFSSDIPGGQGGFDIYKIEKQNGEWSKPINMGELVNTPGDEMYPYEYKDSVLYFSSNGLEGYGGADIFSVKTYKQRLSKPVNLGIPANSSFDDFGISFTTKNTGYFFSNRNAEANTDGLFMFDFPVEVKYDTTNGFIMDALTQEPLSNAKIIIIDKDSFITYLNTDSLGGFSFDKMLPNEIYQLTAKKDKYHDNVMEITSDDEGTINVEMELDPVMALNSIFTLNNILFDYNQYTITTQSQSILDRVAKIMIKNPTAVFELSAHTDARGNDQDNLVLSQNRAQATVYYLLSKGVNESQLTAKGYGEKQLKNKCANGVECSEQEHYQNRRVEIKVVKLN